MNALETALRAALAELDAQRQEVINTMNYYQFEPYPDGQVVQISGNTKEFLKSVVEQDDEVNNWDCAPADEGRVIKPKRKRATKRPRDARSKARELILKEVDKGALTKKSFLSRHRVGASTASRAFRDLTDEGKLEMYMNGRIQTFIKKHESENIQGEDQLTDPLISTFATTTTE